jgi:hypothetical protein
MTYQRLRFSNFVSAATFAQLDKDDPNRKALVNLEKSRVSQGKSGFGGLDGAPKEKKEDGSWKKKAAIAGGAIAAVGAAGLGAKRLMDGKSAVKPISGQAAARAKRAAKINPPTQGTTKGGRPPMNADQKRRQRSRRKRSKR